MEEKKLLRAKMHKLRSNIDVSKKNLYDSFICSELLKIVNNYNCKVVHVYLPMGTEIDISPFIHQLLERNLTVVSPKTLKERQLQHLILNSFDELEDGVFGTKHPLNSIEYIGNYDLIVVPGLAFDNDNFRLGYGGGYYDNFLANNQKALKVGVFYPFQQVNSVPKEPHDIRLDKILIGEDLF